MFSVYFQIFEMMDAKARQDCIKEIGLLKVTFLFILCMKDYLVWFGLVYGV
jgi:hypothetical protein